MHLKKRLLLSAVLALALLMTACILISSPLPCLLCAARAIWVRHAAALPKAQR